MMSVKIYQYRRGSRSALALSRALGGRVLRLENSRYQYKTRDTIINWGSSNCPFPALNGDRDAMRRAGNKLSFFQHHAGAEWLPAFWTNREAIPADAYPIVCRTLLTGHSGDGIVIATNPEELVDAPLYVKYEKKLREYRVHIARINGSGVIFDYAEKKKRRESDVGEYMIRNTANGYVFCRDMVALEQEVRRAAIECFANSGLDFGAIDIIYNAYYERAYVLEINTAPGLEGTTLERYTQTLRRIIL
jgi:glutathione synthase/RimK-type ligase-like ATP-grasp enzyme